MERKFPLGLSRDGELVYGNLEFLDGSRGAHVNISGISGVAAKTSYATFLLYGLFNSGVLENDIINTHAIIFNVKGEDLLFLDKPNSRRKQDAEQGYSKQQVREFIEQFRERPDASGINYEPIKSSPGLFSVRINQAYRAIVFRPPGSDVYVLTWVDHHDDAYRWAERKQLQINPATGALQVISTVDVPVSAPAERAQTAPKIRGLFASVRDKDLLRLGVPEQLLS